VGVLPQRKVPYTANFIHILHAPQRGLVYPVLRTQEHPRSAKSAIWKLATQDSVEPHCRAVRVFPVLSPPLQPTPADSPFLPITGIARPVYADRHGGYATGRLNLRLASQIGVTDIVMRRIGTTKGLSCAWMPGKKEFSAVVVKAFKSFQMFPEPDGESGQSCGVMELEWRGCHSHLPSAAKA